MTRIHSLKKDKNDDGAFRGGRVKHIGTVFNEFYQPVPFFFTRDRMPLHLIGQYRGWGCFLICNGPSLVSGEFDLSLLKSPGVMTYGINNGPKTIRPNFWGCVDDPKRFLKSVWLDPCIAKFVPHAHHDKPLFDSEKWEDFKVNGRQIVVGDCPNIIYYHRNEKLHAERFLFEDTICWGNSGDNGGGRSVMIPAFKILFLLGFRKVYLLGADFKMTENYTYHFDEQRAKGAVNCNMGTYKRMKDEYFPQLKPHFDAEGFEVYNCYKGSELKVFPYKSYLEAINECTMPLGDYKNERTWGLYSKPEERQNWKEEPREDQKVHLKTIVNKPQATVIDNRPDQMPKNIREVPKPVIQEKAKKVENIKKETNTTPGIGAINWGEVVKPTVAQKAGNNFQTMNVGENITVNANNVQSRVPPINVKLLRDKKLEEEAKKKKEIAEEAVIEGVNWSNMGKNINKNDEKNENVENEEKNEEKNEENDNFVNQENIENERVPNIEDIQVKEDPRLDPKYGFEAIPVPDKVIQVRQDGINIEENPMTVGVSDQNGISAVPYVNKIIRNKPCGPIQQIKQNITLKDDGR